MNKGVLSDLTDAAFEQVEDIKKAVKRDVVKGIPQAVKKQIAGDSQDQTQETGDNSQDKNRGKGDQTKTDPVTGKPVPSKKILSDLTRATSQLQSAKIKKIREELDKQRLQVSEKNKPLTPTEESKKMQNGPGVKAETAERAPADNAVAATLKGSKSTGEFKGLVGG